MRFIYTLTVVVLLPFAIIRLIYKSRHNKGYRRGIAQRFGLKLPSSSGSLIWMHAVSVGEFLAVLPLVQTLLEQNPQHQILITTTTPTGLGQIQSKLALEIANKRIVHCYLPFDLSLFARRFIRHFKPQIALFIETEIWPNWIHSLHKSAIPSYLINARLSEKSFNRYRKLEKFSQQTIQKISLISCQNKASAARFSELKGKVNVLGNLKFDIQPPHGLEQKQAEIRVLTANQAFYLAASTHAGEDEIILDTHLSLIKQGSAPLLIIAPRHPERSEEIALLVKQKGLESIRLSQLANITTEQVLIIDRLGQLLYFYSLAELAIIGGSFIRHGGHNPLEAALFKIPCIIGPSSFNFSTIVTEMREKQAIIQCESTQVSELQGYISQLLQSKSPYAENSYRYLQQNQGALARYANLITATVNSESDLSHKYNPSL